MQHLKTSGTYRSLTLAALFLILIATVAAADAPPFHLLEAADRMRPFPEETLLKLGFAYEQGTHRRKPPSTTPPLPGGL